MPKITLLLMTYCQNHFVAEALRSCLSQEADPLEIIASDDASNDGTYEEMLLIAEGYKGTHQLTIRHNDRNMGMIPHLNLLMEMAKGDRIVIAAGDDISSPNRVSYLMQIFDANPDVYAVYSNAICISPDGKKIKQLYPEEEEHRDKSWQSIAEEGTARVTGCGLAWRREVFDRFGPLSDELKAEDQIIPFRAALLGTLAYLPDVSLLYYRQSPSSLTLWRRYVDAFLVINIEEMSKLYLSMVQKNLGDVSAMYEDLIVYRTKLSCERQITKLKKRKEILELEKFVFSGNSVRELLSSTAFKSGNTLKQIKLLLMSIFPSLFLILRGGVIFFKTRNILDKKG